jgi:hypothetical protein
MEGLTQADIDGLMRGDNKFGKKVARKGDAWMSDGEKIALIREVTETVGSHQGKVGSVRRSRKGTPRRMPNGSRYYVRENEWWSNEPSVQAYRLESVTGQKKVALRAWKAPE